MTDAFIYDARAHAARPRQGRRLAARGDRAQSRDAGARRDQGPQQARSGAGRRRGARLRRSGRRGGRRHRARRGADRRLRQQRAGRADQPLLRLRPRCGELRRRRGDVRPARHDDRRRRRIDEPRRHRRLGRRLADGSVDRGPDLFPAAGHLGRPDRHQVRLLARRRRRLCGREPEARREVLGRRPLQELGRAGEGRQRHHASSAKDEHMRPTTTMQSLGALQPSFVQMGEMGGFDAVAVQALSGGRGGQSRASRRQFVRHRRRRRRRADRQQGGRQGGRPEAARAHQGVRQYRLGARDHADRPDRRDREGARRRPA